MSDSRNDSPPSRGRGPLAICVLVVTASLAFACESKDEVSATNQTVVKEVPEVAWREAQTADGTWRVGWRPLEEPIPTLDPFSVEVKVSDPQGGEPPEGTTILVDATMPHHGHGMNVVPRMLKRGDNWVAEGMLLHMPGRWEFVVDVQRDHETERAQWTLMLDQ